MMLVKTIIVEHLRKRYRVREGFRKTRFIDAIKDVSFSVNKGEIHALLGPNGAGKTTTIKILSTLLLPDGGFVSINGYDVVKEAEKVRKIVGLAIDVSKGFYSSLSGFENLVFYGLLKGLSLSDSRRRAREVLELVGLEELRASDTPYFAYSLGMRARLAIAKALLNDPEVLLLDEPTLGLDVESSRHVREMLVKLAGEGKTILVTGHNMHEIEMISDAVTIINKGEVVASGNPSELKNRVGLVFRLRLQTTLDSEPLLKKTISDSLSVKRITSKMSNNGRVEINAIISSSREDIVEALFKASKEQGVKILDLQLMEPSLEDAYLAILGVLDEY
jgi:ABC-2 type transport system ATP-binding protein